ncbi:MAG: hypothetical protein WBG76_16290, partial [Ornithinimicrobium sp.]
MAEPTRVPGGCRITAYGHRNDDVGRDLGAPQDEIGECLGSALIDGAGGILGLGLMCRFIDRGPT